MHSRNARINHLGLSLLVRTHNSASHTITSLSQRTHTHTQVMVVPKTEPDALIKKDASPPPPTTYRDIPLFSCGASESKTHLIKLAHHALIDPRDPARFIPPLKLNRKVPPKLKPVQAKPGDAILDRYGNPMMGAGPDGKAALLWPGTEEEIKAVEAILEKSKPEK